MSEATERANFPEGDGGAGRSTRGPATHVPGEAEPGGLVPPYEGRKEKADIDNEGEHAPQTSDSGGLTSPRPEDTPGGRTASPADEQPAASTPEGEPSDPGVGPAHVAGVLRGEDVTSEEAADSDGGDDGDQAGRSAGTSEPRDFTGISPSEPSTDTPWESGDKDRSSGSL
jgi:hypothetical protein